MKKYVAILGLAISCHVLAAKDRGTGTYICDLRITSSHTETVVLPEAALVFDKGNSFTAQMLGNKVTSPELEIVSGGVKQQATVNGITFFRRANYDDRFIIENSNSGFFYRLRSCKKQ